MANIMLITEYYPPRKSIASNRMEAFANYLTEFGHKVYVITLGDKKEHISGGVDVFRCVDNDLFRLANTNKVENKYKHYAKCIFNILLSSFKVYSKRWVAEVIDCANSICKSLPIDVMITSYPSIGSIVAGNAIKKVFPQIKWIADMRDAVWTSENNRIVRNKLCAITKDCLNEADAILAVSEPQRCKYMVMTGKSCYTVRNGYNFLPMFYEKYNKGSNFVVMYTGNFYGARSPQNFLHACENLIDKKLIPRFRFEIIGNHSVVEIDGSLKGRVVLKDRMEYDDLIEYCCKNADLLLVVIPKSREEGVYTGKLFDYVGIGKPILGLVPSHDVAAQLITDMRNGYLSENEDIKGIEDAILKAYEDWNTNKRKLPEKEIVMSCHRRETVRQLNSIIDDLLG